MRVWTAATRWDAWLTASRFLCLAVLLLAPAAAAENETAAAAFEAVAPLLATGEDAADAEQRDIMPMTTSLPWGAVGFVDNGCTGALIDSQHVLAASHCFTFDFDGTTAAGQPYLQGAWQTGLVFFPNYHPARANPPRIPIDRVIVGSRAQSDPETAADWGIGHLAQPVTGFPALPLSPAETWQYPSFVQFAGYGRDATVYPQQSASFPEPSPGGFCANFKGNCWWIPAFVDPKCLALEEANGYVRTDDLSCPTLGGNSGSPVIRDVGDPGAPTFRITGVISGGGGFWSAHRFRHAPRFAAGLAVASHDDGSQRTQVFATDRDLGRVVSRQRTGTGAADLFTYFRDLGAVPSPGPLAAFRLPNGRPQLVVLGGGSLHTSHATASGWKAWKKLAVPPAARGFLDLAVASDAGGLPQLFLAAGPQGLFTMRATSAGSEAVWEPWVKLTAISDARRVTAVRHGDGRVQVLVVSTTGAVQSLSQTDPGSGSAWSPPVAFGGPALSALVDITAAWATNGRVQVFAVDGTGDGWTRTATGGSPAAGWGAWQKWSVPLHAPAAAKPPRLDGIVSLTASRWQEDQNKVLPVVFATDQQGNIYVTTLVDGAWRPWRSFYN